MMQTETEKALAENCQMLREENAALQADLLEARQALAGAVQGFGLHLVDTRWGRTHAAAITKVQAEYAEGMPMPVLTPIDMVLPCPKCGTLHVDAPEPDKGWENPPHMSHLCHQCGTIWRPAEVPTNGVAALAIRGTADTWPVMEAEWNFDMEVAPRTKKGSEAQVVEVLIRAPNGDERPWICHWAPAYRGWMSSMCSHDMPTGDIIAWRPRGAFADGLYAQAEAKRAAV